MYLTISEEARALRREIIEVYGNPPQIYNIICRGFSILNVRTPGELSLRIGENQFWAQNYRYVSGLSDMVFSIHAARKLNRSIAVLLGNFVYEDQDILVRRLIQTSEPDKLSRTFLNLCMKAPRWRLRGKVKVPGIWHPKKLIPIEQILTEFSH